MTQALETFENKIAETALLTLYMKHLENQQMEPLVRDPNASELVEKINYDFEKFDSAKQSQDGVVVRTHYFDELIRHFIQTNYDSVVINIGCGLDSRAERLSTRTSQTFTIYSVDLPEIMRHRRRLMTPCENEHYFDGSLPDESWMNTIANRHPNAAFMLVIEGVLMYFEPKEIEQALVALTNCFPKCELIFDIINTWMSENSKTHDSVKLMNAEFKSGYDVDQVIAAYSPKLRLLSSRRYSELHEWNRRKSFLARWIMRAVPKFNNSSRILHLKSQ